MIKRSLFLFIVSLFSCQTLANIAGSDLQNFNPTYSGLDFTTVYSSKTLSAGQFNFGAFSTFTTNSLAYSTVSATSNSQSLTAPNDRHLYSSLQLGIGLMDIWDIGVSAGFVNSQEMEEENFLFNFGDTGINDIMLNSKLHIYQSGNLGGALLLGIDFDQIKNNPFSGDNPGPTINMQVAVDYLISPDVLWAINAGYRLRQEGTPLQNQGVTPMSDQWTYSTAIAYTTDSNNSAVIGELYGSIPMEEPSIPTDRLLSNLEAIIGYRWSGLKNFDLHGGIGTEVYHGLGSPDLRAYAGLNWRFDLSKSLSSSSKPQSYHNSSQPKNRDDSDNDGVPDPIDQCPNTKAQERVDETGCTRNKTQSPYSGDNSSKDSDGDGIVDSLDRCSGTVAGARVNGFGCEIGDELNDSY